MLGVREQGKVRRTMSRSPGDWAEKTCPLETDPRSRP